MVTQISVKYNITNVEYFTLIKTNQRGSVQLNLEQKLVTFLESLCDQETLDCQVVSLEN